MPTTSNDIARYLKRSLDADRFPDADASGLFRGDTARSVARLGLALEPDPGIADWIARERLDALFLHRPWRLDPAVSVPVVASHLPFDEALTLGRNPILAAALGVAGELEPFGEKEGRVLGMIAPIPPQTFEAFRARAVAAFGGMDEAHPNRDAALCRRIAVVGAMNDALVRDAADLGVDVYITGQFRKPAARAVAETGLGVLVVGHRRSEEWGLRALAELLRAEFPDLETVLAASD